MDVLPLADDAVSKYAQPETTIRAQRRRLPSDAGDI
jgi:hypothetical protein